MLLGEENINSKAWDSSFEVRVTNAATTRTPYDSVFNPSIQTKKQIIEYQCPGAYSTSSLPIHIDIMAKNWPVSIIWDSLLFDDFCNQNSSIGFTDIADVGYDLSRIDSTSTEGFYGITRPFSFYLSPNGDTIASILYVVFVDSASTTSTSTIEGTDFAIYPNPTSNYLRIKTPKDKLHDVLFYDIFDSRGILVETGELNPEDQVDIRDFSEGLYFLRLHHSSATSYTGAFIKLN